VFTGIYHPNTNIPGFFRHELLFQTVEILLIFDRMNFKINNIFGTLFTRLLKDCEKSKKSKKKPTLSPIFRNKFHRDPPFAPKSSYKSSLGYLLYHMKTTKEKTVWVTLCAINDLASIIIKIDVTEEQ
jgi:hypothetical protein